MRAGFFPIVLSTLAFAAFAAIGLAGPVLAQEVTVQHAQGETLLPQKPVRVVAFDFASIEILDALGVQIVGLPGSNVPPSLAKYNDDAYAKVGSLFEPDFEAVNAAEPDLIIISGRSSPKYAELSKIAPTIDLTVQWKDFIASTRANTQKLGQIFGKETEAAALIQEMDRSISALKAVAPSLGRGLIIMTNGGKVITFGPGSRFGWLHDDLGIAPATTAIQTEASHGQAVSFEFIQQQNPDLLLVLDRDRAVSSGTRKANATLENELVAGTNAWKNDKVVYLDPTRLYIIGASPLSVTALINQIAAVAGRRS